MRTVARWVLGNAVGWAAGVILGEALMYLVGKINWVNVDRAFVFVFLPSIGLTLGFAQGRVVREILPHVQRWARATFAGFMLCLLVFIPLTWARVMLPDPVMLALVGALIGAPQWALLRGQTRGAGWWIAASALGFLSFWWVTAHPAGSMMEFDRITVALGALAAAPTGLALAWMVPQGAVSVES